MRIHLGHHFYGAGNLGDDFMLAGFLTAMRPLAPDATFSCCVPFPLAPLRSRFPSVTWLPYDEANRAAAIAACDVWLGLGGSPFQNAQSRWFVDHLLGEAAACRRAGKPRYFLGVGVQTIGELAGPDLRAVCAGVAGIWTRDAASAARLQAVADAGPVQAAADLAHLFFRATPPPPAAGGRATLVANFDFGSWPGQDACLSGLQRLPASDRVWLAQECRELPGAERAVFAALPAPTQAQWRLLTPEIPGAPLPIVLSRWPSGEWLVTARYHSALAGAWAGSRVIVITTNEKLRAAAADAHAAVLAPDADAAMVDQVLAAARPAPPPREQADLALAACAEFVRSAVAHQR